MKTDRLTIIGTCFATAMLMLLQCAIVSGCNGNKKYIVTTDSMAPTLISGDHVFAKRFTSSSSINRLQIVVVRPPPAYGENMIYIKRVAAVPGDEVLVFTNKLTINGKIFAQMNLGSVAYRDQWHLAPWPVTNECIRYHLGVDEVFVVNDDFRVVNDSRSWGPIKFNSIIGLVESVK